MSLCQPLSEKPRAQEYEHVRAADAQARLALEPLYCRYAQSDLNTRVRSCSREDPRDHGQLTQHRPALFARDPLRQSRTARVAAATVDPQYGARAREIEWVSGRLWDFANDLVKYAIQYWVLAYLILRSSLPSRSQHGCRRAKHFAAVVPSAIASRAYSR